MVRSSDSKGQEIFRAAGIARRQRLLAAARELLATRDFDTLSLADIAERARIPKGSAYHYYDDIMDLYGQLLVLIQEDMHVQLRRPLRAAAIESWPDVIAALLRRGERYYHADPAARQLILSPKSPPQLKLRDRQADVRLGGVFIDHLSAHFVLPELPGREAIFFRAVEIADLMFLLSVLEHGRVVSAMTAEGIRAVNGYLATYLPATLPRRGAGPRPRI